MTIRKMVGELKEAAGYDIEIHRYLDKLIRFLDELVISAGKKPRDAVTELDIQAIRGFRLTAHRAVSMSPSMIQKHVMAYWRHAKDGIQRMEKGAEVAAVVTAMSAIVIPHNEG